MLKIGIFIAALVVIIKSSTSHARFNNSPRIHKQTGKFQNWKPANVSCGFLGELMTPANRESIVPQVIRQSYSNNPSSSKFDKLAQYISNLCDLQSVALGWSTLLQELKSSGKLYSQETMKLAYFVHKDIKKHRNAFSVRRDGKDIIRMFSSLKSQIPREIAQLFWEGKKCSIKNSYLSDYILHTPDPLAQLIWGTTAKQAEDNGKWWSIDQPELVYNNRLKSSTLKFSISFDGKPFRERNYLCVRRRPLPAPLPNQPGILRDALEPFYPQVRVCASDKPAFPFQLELQTKWIFTPVMTRSEDKVFKIQPEGGGFEWSKVFLYMGKPLPLPFHRGRPVLVHAGASTKKESDWEVICE